MPAEGAAGGVDRVELRVLGIRPQAVVAPILTAMGARAGLTIQQLDELELATDMLLRGCTDAPITIVVCRDAGELSVSVEPLAERWAVRRRAILGELAGRIEVDGERAELRAGR